MNWNVLWTNAKTSPLPTIGGVLIAVGGALVSAESAGVVAHVPDGLKLLGFLLAAVGPVLLGSQARQGNITSEDVKGAITKGDNPFPPTSLGLAFCIIATGAIFSGCATSHSTFESAQGDRASKWAVSTIGKQEVQQKTNFVAYPNDSGMELQDGAASNQDATALVPLIQALVTALAGAHPSGTTAGEAAHGNDTSSTTVLQRITNLTNEIAQLRALVPARVQP